MNNNKIIVDFSKEYEQSDKKYLANEVSLLIDCCQSYAKGNKDKGDTLTLYNTLAGGTDKYLKLKGLESIDSIIFLVAYSEMLRRIIDYESEVHYSA